MSNEIIYEEFFKSLIKEITGEEINMRYINMSYINQSINNVTLMWRLNNDNLSVVLFDKCTMLKNDFMKIVNDPIMECFNLMDKDFIEKANKFVKESINKIKDN